MYLKYIVRELKKVQIFKKAVITFIVIIAFIFTLFNLKDNDNNINIIQNPEIPRAGDINEIFNDSINEEINETEKEISEDSAESLIVIDVSGAVNNPGVIVGKEGIRVYEAISLAGGIRSDGDLSPINQASILSDGDKLHIPSKNELESSHGHNEIGILSSQNTVERTQTGKVNINTANLEELQRLKGIGPSTAQKIIDFRIQNGLFKTKEGLMGVSGIGAKTFESLKNDISI